MYGRKAKRKLIIQYLIFFAFALTFWLIQNLNKPIETYWEVPLEIGIYQNNTLIESSTFDLSVLIKGKGWSFLWSEWKPMPSKLEYNISYSDLEILSEPFLLGLAAEKLKHLGFTPIKITPNKIELKVKTLTQKTLKIIQPLSITFRKGYGSHSQPIFSDTLLTIIGKYEDLPTFDFVVLDTLFYKDVHSNIYIQRTLDLFPENSLLQNKNELTGNITVEKFTEGKIELEPQIKGAPTNKKFRFLPNTISIIYSVPMSYYDKVSQEDFEVWINYDEIIPFEKELNAFVQLHVSNSKIFNPKVFPAYISVVVYEKE
jgi:hypothetical protein